MLSHDDILSHSRFGGFDFPVLYGRRNRTIGKVRPPTGKTAKKCVVVIPIYKSREETKW